MFWVSASAGWYQKYTVTIYWHVPSRINQPNIINWFSWQLNLVIVAWSNIVIILQFGRNRSTYCCYAGNVRREQGFGCNIIATLKIMQYNNCSSTLLQFCNNIELLPSPSQCTRTAILMIQSESLYVFPVTLLGTMPPNTLLWFMYSESRVALIGSAIGYQQYQPKILVLATT